MGNDSRALTDLSTEELDIVTTAGAATTDYTLVIVDDVPKKILISDLATLVA